MNGSVARAIAIANTDHPTTDPVVPPCLFRTSWMRKAAFPSHVGPDLVTTTPIGVSSTRFSSGASANVRVLRREVRDVVERRAGDPGGSTSDNDSLQAAVSTPTDRRPRCLPRTLPG
jgi:hypothetical protein